MVILLRLVALVIVIGTGFWIYQNWLAGRTPPTQLALPAKGVFPGPTPQPLDRDLVERLHERASGQRY